MKVVSGSGEFGSHFKMNIVSVGAPSRHERCFMRDMSTILITTSSFQVDTNPALQSLKAKGLQIVLNPFGRRLTEADAQELLTEYDPIGMVAGVEPLTRKVLESAPALKVIARCGIGMDSVDLIASEDLGIAVSNTPDAPSTAVAELTIGLILSILREIPQADRGVRSGAWKARMGSLFLGKTLGLIGGGRIGQKVAHLATSLGAQVIVHDPFIKTSDFELTTFEDLLARADIVSLHIPGGDDTHHLIDQRAIECMKPGAFLINTGRGGLVDEAALARALRTGHLSGAALDVYEDEPYSGKLTALDNVVLTAHMGSYAKETRAIMEREAAENLLTGLQATAALE